MDVRSTGKGTWFEVSNIDTIDSPALLIFEERVVMNIDLAIKMVGNVDRLRPHVKTHKNAETSRLMMERGIYKFKCATIAEAQMLATCGAQDILVSYPLVGPKLNRFIQLVKSHPAIQFSCLIDNVTTAKQLSTICMAEEVRVTVYIDLNVGMNRTGISPGEEALTLYKMLAELPQIKVAGLHAYDGHQREPNFESRKTQVIDGFQPVLELKKQISDAGLPEPIIIAGGSPTFSVHALFDDRECSPGTFVYWDHGYLELCKEQAFLPAAVLITRVISLPASNRICTDLGHKSVAAENEISKRIHFLTDNSLKPVGQSEEHLVMEAGDDHQYKVGDLLYGIPYHICPTVALFDRLIVVKNQRAQGNWKVIARDRNIEASL